MSFSELYKRKLMTAEEAVRKIHSHDEIVAAVAASEPAGLLSKLHTIRDQVEDVSVVMVLPLGEYDFYMKPEMKGHFMLNAWYYGGGCRKVHGQGTVSYNPTHLHNCMAKRIDTKNPRIFFGTAAPMDKNGCLNLSLGVMIEKEAIENADLVVIEVNENLPRVHGDNLIHIRDVDVIVENHRAIPALPAIVPSEKDKLIGQYIAELVEDGSTIQLGIGGIPNAAALFLSEKRDLGVHTEMLSDAIVDLVEAGAVTGREKTIWKDKIVSTFAFGSKKLYDFMNENPMIEMQRGAVVNDPYIVGRNHKMVSINTTLQVDLFGQCCSEAIGFRQYSGSGGAADTAAGAQKSKGGKSIMALYSTVREDSLSSIMPALSPGAAVTVSRNDVDYVVTEYGIASLRGTNIAERVARLSAVAHPKFRDMLQDEAKKLQLF